MQEFLQKAKESVKFLYSLDGAKKNSALMAMADSIDKNRAFIITENEKDVEAAKASGLSEAMIDRLILDEKRVADMAASVREIAALKEPVGRVLDGWVNGDGLKIEKVSVPIGVVAIIYESRPNVTSDAAALCFKSGNVAVLKGGKEAALSNAAIAAAMQEALTARGLPKELISLLPDGSREGVMKLVKMDKFVDLIIPRGGESLIRAVCDNSSVPVVKHDKGLCHLFVEASAAVDKAINITVNAKTQRPGVCNAIETLLVDCKIAAQFLPKVKAALDAKGTQLKGCAKTAAIIKVEAASEEDYHTEHLANILNIKVVDGVEAATEHIAKYGSGHSDAIVTEDYHTAELFLNSVDSACVYVNASTRFTDGGCFGFGAEVGISTNKLHSRGPMGINDLTTYKYTIRGSGHVRG